MQRLVRAARVGATEVGLWLGAVLLTSAPFAFAIDWMRAATSRHWSLGAVVAAGCLALLTVGLYELHRHQERITAVRMLVGTVLLTVLMASVVCGWWSYLVWRQNAAAYTSPHAISIDQTIEYYLWLFWDLLPGLKVTETLNLPAPLHPTTPAAGLPVLAFRALVLFGLLNAVRQWWARDAADQGAARPRSDQVEGHAGAMNVSDAS